MKLEVKHCRQNDTYYLQITTPAYHRMGLRMKNLNSKWQRIEKKYPEAAQELRELHADIKRRREKERRFLTLVRDDIPADCTIREIPKPPKQIDRVSRKVYDKWIEKLRQKVIHE